MFSAAYKEKHGLTAADGPMAFKVTYKHNNETIFSVVEAKESNEAVDKLWDLGRARGSFWAECTGKTMEEMEAMAAEEGRDIHFVR